MGRSVVARCVSLLLKFRYKPSEKQAEEDLEKLLQNGEAEPPMLESLPARYTGRVFYINENAASDAVVLKRMSTHRFSPPGSPEPGFFLRYPSLEVPRRIVYVCIWMFPVFCRIIRRTLGRMT